MTFKFKDNLQSKDAVTFYASNQKHQLKVMLRMELNFTFIKIASKIEPLIIQLRVDNSNLPRIIQRLRELLNRFFVMDTEDINLSFEIYPRQKELIEVYMKVTDDYGTMPPFLTVKS